MKYETVVRTKYVVEDGAEFESESLAKEYCENNIYIKEHRTTISKDCVRKYENILNDIGLDEFIQKYQELVARNKSYPSYNQIVMLYVINRNK